MTAPAVTTPTATQQSAVQAYFTEAEAPTVIGTSAAAPHLSDALNTAGLVLEQIGKSCRLLLAARLAAASDPFTQATEPLNQAFGAVVTDCNEIQRLLMRLAQHSAQIDAGNASAKTAAQQLGYVII